MLSGNYFQPGLTTVFFNSTGLPDIPLSNLTVVNQKKITGTISVSNGPVNGKYNVVVLTPDGGTGRKTNALTVKPWSPPKVSTVMPTKAYINSTTAFTISGNYFQPGAMVNFTNTAYPGGNLTTEITVVSLTKITGNLTVPYNAPTGKWNVVVTTPDGGQGAPKTNAFTVKEWSKPTVSSVNPAKGKHGTTLNYAITGTNFQPGSTVTFTNTSAPGLNFTAGVNTLTMTKITGSVDIPVDRTGKYGIEVLCPDGKTGKKDKAFTLT